MSRAPTWRSQLQWDERVLQGMAGGPGEEMGWGIQQDGFVGAVTISGHFPEC